MTNKVFTIAERIEIHTARVNEYTREAEAFAKVGDEKRAQIAKLQEEADARIAEELAQCEASENGEEMKSDSCKRIAKAAGLVQAVALKALSISALAVGVALAFAVLFGSAFLFSELLECIELPGMVKGFVMVVYLLTIGLDLACWSSLQYMNIANRLNLFKGVGGLNSWEFGGALFIRPRSVIATLVNNIRTA